MATNYAKHTQTRVTPQSEPIPGKQQVPNSAGGFTFAVDDWTRLDRFLILGNEGGTYYAGEKALTIKNAACVQRCLDSDPTRTIKRIVEISTEGRAAKNDPALFALAMAFTSIQPEVQFMCNEALPKVARIGTHLFHFVAMVTELRGWGRGLKNAVRAWYLTMEPDTLEVQVTKYKSRDKWSHRDLLRLAHPKPKTKRQKKSFEFVVTGKLKKGKAGAITMRKADVPILIPDYLKLQDADTPAKAVKILAKNEKLTWEMCPTEVLGAPDVWRELLPRMPLTALIRNLGRMSANGTIGPMNGSPETKIIVERLADVEELKRARVHPVQALSALLVYAQGHGERGGKAWKPNGDIRAALGQCFEDSFQTIVPTGKRFVLGLDISGSMDSGTIAGVPGLTPRIGVSAMAMVTARSEEQFAMVGFTNGPGRSMYSSRGFGSGLTVIPVSRKDSIDDVTRRCASLPMGGTDCALPMLWALQNKVAADAFVIYTDNETWHGDIHPSQALQQYRREMGIPAKLIVVGMTATECSIADPHDAGMLDLVGFDTASPALISEFAKR